MKTKIGFSQAMTEKEWAETMYKTQRAIGRSPSRQWVIECLLLLKTVWIFIIIPQEVGIVPMQIIKLSNLASANMCTPLKTSEIILSSSVGTMFVELRRY